MAKPTTTIVTTDVFQTWLDRTNDLLTDLSTVIVTTDTTVAGATTSGNVHLDGNLDAGVISVQSIRGGTNTLGSGLIIDSDALVRGDLTVTDLSVFQGGVDITGGTLDVNVTATFLQTINGSITGSAASADQLTTPRTINLIGPVTGSATFDGTSDINILTSTSSSPTQILADLLTVDGTGSGLDADLLDGLDSTAFVRTDQDTVVNGSITANSVSLSDNGNVWDVEATNGQLTISYNGTKLFKLSSTGNLTIKGDITAFGTL